MGTCSNFFLLSFLCIFAVQGFLDSLTGLLSKPDHTAAGGF